MATIEDLKATISKKGGLARSNRFNVIFTPPKQSLLNLTAQQHYISLFEERPELLSVIPLKYISSYIGVTPQALSRIRKRIY